MPAPSTPMYVNIEAAEGGGGPAGGDGGWDGYESHESASSYESYEPYEYESYESHEYMSSSGAPVSMPSLAIVWMSATLMALS